MGGVATWSTSGMGARLPVLLTAILRSPICNRNSLKSDSSRYLIIWMTSSSFKSMAHPPEKAPRYMIGYSSYPIFQVDDSALELSSDARRD